MKNITNVANQSSIKKMMDHKNTVTKKSQHKEVNETKEKPVKRANVKKYDEVNSKTFNKILKNSKNRIEAFKKFITELSVSQAQHNKNITINVNISITKGEGTDPTETPESPAVESDNYWGVEQTAGRILEMAKKLGGNDPKKLEMLKGAFQKGFDEAKRIFGGQLPEISQKTYDKVMEGFDELITPSQETQESK